MAKLTITLHDDVLEALEIVSGNTGLKKSAIVQKAIAQSLEDIELAFECDQIMANSDPDKRVSLEEIMMDY